MKVKIVQVVEVDPQKWADAYGIELDQVRADVKAHFEGVLHEHLESIGLAPA